MKRWPLTKEQRRILHKPRRRYHSPDGDRAYTPRRRPSGPADDR